MTEGFLGSQDAGSPANSLERDPSLLLPGQPEGLSREVGRVLLRSLRGWSLLNPQRSGDLLPTEAEWADLARPVTPIDIFLTSTRLPSPTCCCRVPFSSSLSLVEDDGQWLDYTGVEVGVSAPMGFPLGPPSLVSSCVLYCSFTRDGSCLGTADLFPPRQTGRIFVVPEASGGWRPILDLSALNLYLRWIHFRMETTSLIRDAAAFCVGREVSPVQGPPFRPLSVSVGVHPHHQRVGSSFMLSRLPSPDIPRRLADPGKQQLSL